MESLYDLYTTSIFQVEWYKDGRPITASSRISTIFNFGYVSLNIMHLRAEDAGSYTVRAVNHLGEAISTATVQVFSKSTVTGDLGIPEQQRYIEKVNYYRIRTIIPFNR